MRRLFSFFLLAFLLIVLCSCELSYQAPAVGKMRILVFGNDYSYGSAIYKSNGEQFTGRSAERLYKTVNDAQQVGRALSALAEKAGLEHQTVELTAISDVTETRLKAELEGLASVSSENDITMIFYSGHGFGVDTKLDYDYDTSTVSYLIPRYSAKPDSSVLFPVSTFLDLVNAIKGVKVVIGDFCHSGSLVQSNYFSVTSGEYLQMDASYLFAKYRDDICINPSLFCLSASRYNELSYEIPDKDKYGNPLPNVPKHGYFTYALLEALGWDEENQCLKAAKAEKDNRITLSQIAEYVTANDGKSAQNPMVSGGSNDIVLFSF